VDNMLVLAGISVVVGFLGSLIGLGGAAILIPLLVLFGIPVKEAIASAIVRHLHMLKTESLMSN